MRGPYSGHDHGRGRGRGHWRGGEPWRPQPQRQWLTERLEDRGKEEYRPLKAGSIDGTDVIPHDHAVIRAINSNWLNFLLEPGFHLSPYISQNFLRQLNTSHYVPTTRSSVFKGKRKFLTPSDQPSSDPKIRGNPRNTLFVGRLNFKTTEDTLYRIFGEFGPIEHLRLVKDIVTGHSRGYAFISYEREEDFKAAWHSTNKIVIDDHTILVEYERERIQKGWKPRRLGGGLGGKKESGQLRFGGRDRPFQVPLTTPEVNPLVAPGGIFPPIKGVMAALDFGDEGEKKEVVYMKQDGKKVSVTHL